MTRSFCVVKQTANYEIIKDNTSISFVQFVKAIFLYSVLLNLLIQKRGSIVNFELRVLGIFSVHYERGT